jgi:predicted nucleotidyltransferase
MIVNKFLNYLFTSPSIIAILRELDMRTVGISGREISRLVNVTHKTALKALDNLEALKLIKRNVVGKSYYFTLNREQFIYKNIISVIFKNEIMYKQKLIDNLIKLKNDNVVSLIIFGSVARNEETYESDFDLCIVYQNKKNEIQENIGVLQSKLYEEFGVTLAPFYITEDDFKQKAISLKPPVNNIIKEGNVIWGKSINRIVNG